MGTPAQDYSGAGRSRFEKRGKKSEADFEALRELFKAHIESFDYFIDAGLETALHNITPVEVTDPSRGTKLRNILSFRLPWVYFSGFCLSLWISSAHRGGRSFLFPLTSLALWFGKPELLPPEREGARKVMREPLLPHEVGLLAALYRR